MAGSLNKVMLIGNLGADPGNSASAQRRLCGQSADRDLRELARQDDRRAPRKDRVAQCRRFQRQSRPRHRAVCQEGSKIYIEGQLQTRKYQDKSGQDRYSTEVVLQGFSGNLTLLDGRGEGGGRARDGRPSPGGSDFRPLLADGASPAPAAGGGRHSDLDDDIPF
jgi:single-strand DNA-binding protein